MSEYLNMQRLPLACHTRLVPEHLWTGEARRIAELLGEVPEYLFDPTLYAPDMVPRSFDISVDLRPALPVEVPPLPDAVAESQELKALIANAVHTLVPHEQIIIKRTFGLIDEDEHSLSDVGEDLGLTEERIRQIQARALRKLRHAMRTRTLLPYVS